MSGVYDREGVKFLFPENWELSDEGAGELPRVISLQSPTSGFWSLHVYEGATEPDELASQVRDTMREEYDSLEAEPANERMGQTDTVGYDLEFYCLDMVATARVRAFRSGQFTFLMLAQAESRDFEKLADVFRAMTVSLLAYGASRH
jgi:hypothetical protein